MDNTKKPSTKPSTAERLTRLLSAAEATLEVYEEKGRLDFSTEHELEAAIESARDEKTINCRKPKSS